MSLSVSTDMHVVCIFIYICMYIKGCVHIYELEAWLSGGNNVYEFYRCTEKKYLSVFFVPSSQHLCEYLFTAEIGKLFPAYPAHREEC